LHLFRWRRVLYRIFDGRSRFMKQVFSVEHDFTLFQ
jgi:hypothetical protein